MPITATSRLRSLERVAHRQCRLAAFQVFLIGGPTGRVIRVFLMAIGGLGDEIQRTPTVHHFEEIRGGVWIGRPLKADLECSRDRQLVGVPITYKAQRKQDLPLLVGVTARSVLLIFR
jgi:hypothetical protein